RELPEPGVAGVDDEPVAVIPVEDVPSWEEAISYLIYSPGREGGGRDQGSRDGGNRERESSREREERPRAPRRDEGRSERERPAEQARIEEQLEARRTAARKAMMEARALADEKMRREAEQAAEAERLRIEQAVTQAAETIAKHQQASQSISELQVGAWLEISREQNADEKLRAKLSVIISSTGKYIFADQVGRKLAEYTREQLITLMVEEQLKILRNGDNFEDQLAKVIRGLRRDVS
ncbi:DUF1631 family protein, partial [Cellvibrio sp.]